MKIEYSDPSKNDWFLISWNITNKCNYRCSYCPSQLHNGSLGWPNFEIAKDFVEKFNPLGKKLCYRITGGEPTYWKHFIDLAKIIKERGHTFSFLSNGSQTVEYYKSIAGYTDGIIISYHPEYSSIEHFSEIAKCFSSPVIVNFMMVPDKFEELLHVAKRLYDLSGDNLSIWPKVIVDKTSSLDEITNDPIYYTNEQKSIIENWPYFRKLKDNDLHRGDIVYNGKKVSANELILSDLNNHIGWKCWAGLHMLSIDNNGQIYRSDCRQGGSIGTLKSFSRPTDPLICSKPRCACLSDIYLKKSLD